MGQRRVNNPQKTGRRQQKTASLKNTGNTTQRNKMVSKKDPINNHEGQHTLWIISNNIQWYDNLKLTVAITGHFCFRLKEILKGYLR